MFDRITIIGLGLIGSSIARAVKTRQLAGSLIVCDSGEAALALALGEKFADLALRDALSAVTNASLVILATPPGSLGGVAAAISPNLRSGALLMDVASVKTAAIEAIAAHLPGDVRFVPTHPIAGAEQSGGAAGRADLFVNKRVILTPAHPEEPGVLQAAEFWRALDARVEVMPPALHDAIYAHVSHLPQLIAFAMRPIVAPYLDPPGRYGEAFARFSRLCHSNPALWDDIFRLNRNNIRQALEEYAAALARIAGEMEAGARNQPPSPPPDSTLASTALFPRIVAACLVATVMTQEKRLGFKMAAYAGSGMQDFTAPASSAPEGDMEAISNSAEIVAPLLRNLLARLAERMI